MISLDLATKQCVAFQDTNWIPRQKHRTGSHDKDGEGSRISVDFTKAYYSCTYDVIGSFNFRIVVAKILLDLKTKVNPSVSTDQNI